MATDQAGILWTVMTIGGPLVLLAALVYGVMRYSRRTRSEKVAGDNAAIRMQQRGARQEDKDARRDDVN
jgi:hypothetical protein